MTTTTDQNQHIVEYLDYYIDELQQAPQYAVLLKGQWGAGKTWFIDQYFKGRKYKYPLEVDRTASEKEHLSISLNGMRSIADIDNEIFAKLNPFLSHPGVKLVGAVLRSAIKLSVNIDLDGDKKPEASIANGAFDHALFDVAKKARKKIFVFDDLERCAIPITELMGYINQYVEHSEARAILLANEIEITKKGDDGKETERSSSYLTTKEKLIGKEFEIRQNVSDALASFLDLLNPDAKSLIEKYDKSVELTYIQSGHNNLRALKQALLDYQHLLRKINPAYLENVEFGKQLSILFCIYSLEIATGKFSPSEIETLGQLRYMSSLAADSELKTKLLRIAEKYPFIDLSNSIFSKDSWVNIFSLGLNEADKLNQEIKRSIYFKTMEEEPDWKKLWRYRDIDDEDVFYRLLLNVEKSFRERQNDELGVVIHLFGLLLNLSKEGLLSLSEGEISKIGRENVLHLLEERKLPDKDRWSSYKSDKSWDGLGFHSRDSIELKDLFKFIDEQIVTNAVNSYPEGALVVLKWLEEDKIKFVTELTSDSGRIGDYANIPILKFIPIKTFINAWIIAPSRDKRTVAHVLERRYQTLQGFPEVAEELDWLEALQEEMNKTVENTKTMFLKKKYEEFGIDTINYAIKNIRMFLDSRKK